MKREILQYPDERLRLVSQPVEKFTPELQTLIQDMIETMIDAHGIGLAAPQIGVQQRVVVIARSIIEEIERMENEEIQTMGEELDSEEESLIEEKESPLECLVIVNPTLTCSGDIITYQEGCLSVPEYREFVERYSNVTLSAYDGEGNPYTLDASGLLAVCIQHELDHLEGKLFIDRLSYLKRSLYHNKITKRYKR